MKNTRTILVHEYGRLVVGEIYGGIEFEQRHLLALGQYATRNSEARYFNLYLNFVTFNQFVGVIRVGELTIEVLPKTDKHTLELESWQKILFRMLMISLKVDAKITTPANVALGTRSVLEAYIHQFLDQVKKLIHDGLVKKYRTTVSNQSILKGKLLIHQHITKNVTHAERFYVAHQIYDRDNLFNSILFQALVCLQGMNLSDNLRMRLMSCLLDFPECARVKVNERLFANLIFDRKTERYRSAIALARIILMNYHPDVRSGKNSVLAIMFDMNLLWETYVFAVVREASTSRGCTVTRHATKPFWENQDGRHIVLEPDLVIKKAERTIVLDTKWKYRKSTSPDDIRQMYAYSVYFKSDGAYLLYPDNLPGSHLSVSEGNFFNPSYLPNDESKPLTKEVCGLVFIDPIVDSGLDKEFGTRLLDHCLLKFGVGEKV